MIITPNPAFPHRGRSQEKLFPLGGNGKGGGLIEVCIFNTNS